MSAMNTYKNTKKEVMIDDFIALGVTYEISIHRFGYSWSYNYTALSDYHSIIKESDDE